MTRRAIDCGCSPMGRAPEGGWFILHCDRHAKAADQLAAVLAGGEGEPEWFPIQSQRGASPHPTRIPWALADLAYSVYSARYGRDQSLAELARRGGFGPNEMDMFVPDWRDRCSRERALVEAGRFAARENTCVCHAEGICGTCQLRRILRTYPPSEKDRERAADPADADRDKALGWITRHSDSRCVPDCAFDLALLLAEAREEGRREKREKIFNAAQKPLDNEPSKPYIEVIRSR